MVEIVVRKEFYLNLGSPIGIVKIPVGKQDVSDFVAEHPYVKAHLAQQKREKTVKPKSGHVPKIPLLSEVYVDEEPVDDVVEADAVETETDRQEIVDDFPLDDAKPKSKD